MDLFGNYVLARADTQRIESNWNAIKSAILTHTGGVMVSLHRRLVEYAWRMEHRENPFSYVYVICEVK